MNSENKTPKCVPLCYPGNYKWDKSKGKLVEKEKKRGQLVVCEDAMEIIRSIEGPICTVAVTGPARSGKSYIASQLIEPRPQACVFKTSHTQNRETMGIWMSTDVFKKTLSNGTEVTVIILDTEGLDAHNAYEKDDMLLFALMALMSSVLVYNSSNTVRAEDLNKLSWVNRYIKVFSWSGSSRKKTTLLENEFIKFFPNFMWLLRDVTMSFVISQDDKDVKVDFKHYLLEEVLKQEMEEDTTEGEVTERNATRRALLKSFPVFDALTLSTPSIDKSVLEDMDKGNNKGSLSKTFLADIEVFITRCGTLMKPKKAWPHDGNINGHQFANMLKQYVSRFSETQIINVDAVVPSVIEAQLQQVVDLVFTAYRNDMDEYANAAIPCQNYEIIEKHNDCLYQAMRKFKENAKCINDADSLKEYRDALKEELAHYRDGYVVGGYLRILLEQNEKMSDEFCRQLVDELFLEISKPGKMYRRQSSGSNIDLLNEQYKERARGPKIWHVYKTKLAAKIEDMSSSRSKEYVSFENDADLNMYVREKAAEIEELEKKRIKEKILEMEEEYDEKSQAMMAEDIADQLKQLETDFQERSGSTQVQIETLRRTHVGMAKDLQLLLNDMAEEKKKKHDELTRKQEEVMRQS